MLVKGRRGKRLCRGVLRWGGQDRGRGIGKVTADVSEAGELSSGPGDDAGTEADLAGLFVPQEPVRGVQAAETADDQGQVARLLGAAAHPGVHRPDLGEGADRARPGRAAAVGPAAGDADGEDAGSLVRLLDGDRGCAELIEDSVA